MSTDTPTGRHAHPRPAAPRRGLRALAAGGALALLGATGLTYLATSAAFTATTQTAPSSFTAGTVVLTNSATGSAMFTLGNLAPGDPASARCVRVQYTGTLESDVELYASAGGSGLADHVTQTIEEGSGTAADCSDFTGSGTSHPGSTLTALATSHSSFATGLGTWTPNGPGQRTYRVTTALPAATPNAAQGLTATLTLTWEARNT